jgi:hypothetical protein
MIAGANPEAVYDERQLLPRWLFAAAAQAEMMEQTQRLPFFQAIAEES